LGMRNERQPRSPFAPPLKLFDRNAEGRKLVLAAQDCWRIFQNSNLPK